MVFIEVHMVFHICWRWNFRWKTVNQDKFWFRSSICFSIGGISGHIWIENFAGQNWILFIKTFENYVQMILNQAAQVRFCDCFPRRRDKPLLFTARISASPHYSSSKFSCPELDDDSNGPNRLCQWQLISRYGRRGPQIWSASIQCISTVGV